MGLLKCWKPRAPKRSCEDPPKRCGHVAVGAALSTLALFCHRNRARRAIASLHVPSPPATTQLWLLRLRDAFPLTRKHTVCDLKMSSQLHEVSCKGLWCYQNWYLKESSSVSCSNALSASTRFLWRTSSPFSAALTAEDYTFRARFLALHTLDISTHLGYAFSLWHMLKGHTWEGTDDNTMEKIFCLLF